MKIITGHLKACFDNVVDLSIIDPGGDDTIEGIHSSEKEVVKLKKPSKTKDQIEKWLCEFQKNIRDTLHSLLKEALKDYGN